MREIRSSGLEGGVEFYPPSLPLFYSLRRPLTLFLFCFSGRSAFRTLQEIGFFLM